MLATAAKRETETQTPEPWGATDAGGRRLAQLRESARSYYETVNQAHIGMRWNLLKDDLLQQSEPSDPSEAPSADATGLNPRNPCSDPLRVPQAQLSTADLTVSFCFMCRTVFTSALAPRVNILLLSVQFNPVSARRHAPRARPCAQDPQRQQSSKCPSHPQQHKQCLASTDRLDTCSNVFYYSKLCSLSRPAPFPGGDREGP